MIRCRLIVLALVLLAAAGSAHGEAALGPRIGLGGPGDDLFLGVQGEFGPVVGQGVLVPSLDFWPGDGPDNILNLDLRFYLIRLPETGLRIYGAAGPSWQYSGDTELGWGFTVGLHIPMQGLRRYNLEYRWGMGDIPDHKIALAVMFGL